MSTYPPDPLAPFVPKGYTRSAPATWREPEAAAATVDKPTRYRAFGVADGPTRPLRLEMRQSDGGIAILRPYSSILEIAYDRAGYGGIWLTFPQVKFAILGSGLQPVFEAIRDGLCEWICEAANGESGSPGHPIITRIADQPYLATRAAARGGVDKAAAGSARPQSTP